MSEDRTNKDPLLGGLDGMRAGQHWAGEPDSLKHTEGQQASAESDTAAADPAEKTEKNAESFSAKEHTAAPGTAGKDAEEVERMDSEIRTVGNIDEVSAEILQLFDYAALGHIHKPMKLGSECIRYCGTMLACSVSEAGQQKGVIEVELGEKGEVQTRILPLHPLRQIKVLRGTAEEILAQACEDYVSVTLTDTPDFDTQDRLRAAFPYLLEIRRDTLLQRDYAGALRAQEKLDPYDVCCSFLGDAPDEEKAILQEIVNTVFTEGETK